MKALGIRPRHCVIAATVSAVVLAACIAPGSGRSPDVTAAADQDQPRWTPRAPVPTARTEVAAAARRGEIFVVGGFADGAGSVATVEVYEPQTDSWRSAPDLPIPVDHAMAASLQGRLYVAGGNGPGGRSERVFAFRRGRWSEVAPMPAARAAGGMVALGGRLYVAGGVSAAGPADSTFVYNPDADRWKAVTGLPQPREHLAAAPARRRLWVVAGRTGGLATNTAFVHSFNPVAGKWRRRRDVPTGRGGLAGAAARGRFVIAVGGEGPDGTFAEVEAFDLEAGAWLRLPDLPTPRHGLGAVVVDGILYVLAGGPEPGLTYSSANEALDLTEFEP